jgi:hypothetical protein
MSAVFSECGLFRYLLEREVQQEGIVIGYCGVNGSTAGAEVEDQTTMKWRGFTLRNGGRRYIAFNPFAYRSTDVRELARVPDPVGPLNAKYIREAIARSDLLVPCWGNRAKVPTKLRAHFYDILGLMLASGKPIKVFGLTKSGDPKHPLMLGYNTQLQDWRP